MVKVLLRDPIALDELRRKLQILGFRLSPERDKWLVRHSNHSGLVLEASRLYCRTCKEKCE